MCGKKERDEKDILSCGTRLIGLLQQHSPQCGLLTPLKNCCRTFFSHGFQITFTFGSIDLYTMDSDSGSDHGGEAPHFPRDLPNILITGTPGTGKTTTSEMAAEATGLTHINVGDLVKAKALHEGLDKEYDSYILDEDKVTL
jgi:Cdc6-like AAA superfamily ATPase